MITVPSVGGVKEEGVDVAEEDAAVGREHVEVGERGMERSLVPVCEARGGVRRTDRGEWQAASRLIASSLATGPSAWCVSS